MALRERQRRFVAEYLIDLNATQAARRAGYSEQTARQMGAENLSKPDIQDAISVAMQERSARTQMAADEVLQRLARIARAAPGEYATWGPDGVTLRPSGELTADQSYCVAEISEAKDGRLRFKLLDRVRALELCGKHLGLFPDRLNVEGGTLNVVMELIGHAGSGERSNGTTTPRANGVLPE